MGDKARLYKPSTIRRLDTLSGNECAEPTCRKPLIAEDGHSIISKICHIEAASENGPRWNENMTDDERRHYSNLILMCDEHHTIIDNKENEDKFSVELLKDWKLKHESKALYKLRNSSLLKIAIDAISDLNFEVNIDEGLKIRPFDIELKIQHNDIKRNRHIIDEYKVFYPKINSLYKELENQGNFKKEKLLRNIKNLYLRSKGKYVTVGIHHDEQLRKNADNIFEDVENELFELVKQDGDSFHEDVVYGISVIMVDAFMRCKILEEPN